MDYDKTNMPAAYDAGRRYSPAVLALWLDVISRWVPKGTVSEISTSVVELAATLWRWRRILMLASSPSIRQKRCSRRLERRRRKGFAMSGPPQNRYRFQTRQSIWSSCRWSFIILTTPTKPSENAAGY